MNKDEIFNRLWRDYAAENPSAGAIHALFRNRGNRVLNDHVAFRTFDHPRVSIDVLARPFIDSGYVRAGEYFFEDKQLKAAHFEHPDPLAPLVFISELLTGSFSPFLQQTVSSVVGNLPGEALDPSRILFSGKFMEHPSYAVYEQLRTESEYAGWLYVFGFRANHFTVSVNHLDTFDSLQEVNAFLKANGHALNSSGGEIKGTPEQLLEQSSTLADRVLVQFEEGLKEIPSCYYEFARRYTGPDGRLFRGFIARSADKIFESTDFRR